MTDNPVIRYQGKAVQVTQDTAREFVDSGEAELISGDLPPAPKAKKAEKPKPEDVAAPKPKAAKKPDGRRKKPTGE